MDTANITIVFYNLFFQQLYRATKTRCCKTNVDRITPMDPILRRWLHANFILIIYILEIPSPSLVGSDYPVILVDNYVQGVTVHKRNFIT